MADAGMFGHDDRVELVEGEVVDMAPVGSQHTHVVNQLTRLFTLAAADRCLVSAQNPIRLDDRSEPQPDLALLKPGNYMTRLPGLADILLLVEVASSSIDYDRSVKLDLDARQGIPEVWLLDLTGNEWMVCRDPVQGRYRWMEKTQCWGMCQSGVVAGVEWRLGAGKTGVSPCTDRVRDRRSGRLDLVQVM